PYDDTDRFWPYFLWTQVSGQHPVIVEPCALSQRLNFTYSKDVARTVESLILILLSSSHPQDLLLLHTSSPLPSAGERGEMDVNLGDRSHTITTTTAGPQASKTSLDLPSKEKENSRLFIPFNVV
ncbi:nad dependent epimerase dehydratase family protein, partial [Cystoisospora suis]